MSVYIPLLVKGLRFSSMCGSDQTEQPSCAECVKTVNSLVSGVWIIRVERYAQILENNRCPEIDGIDRIRVRDAAQVATTAEKAWRWIDHICVIEGAVSIFDKNVLIQVRHEIDTRRS